MCNTLHMTYFRCMRCHQTRGKHGKGMRGICLCVCVCIHMIVFIFPLSVWSSVAGEAGALMPAITPVYPVTKTTFSIGACLNACTPLPRSSPLLLPSSSPVLLPSSPPPLLPSSPFLIPCARHVRGVALMIIKAYYLYCSFYYY